MTYYQEEMIHKDQILHWTRSNILFPKNPIPRITQMTITKTPMTKVQKKIHPILMYPKTTTISRML
eukprot:UN28419